MADPTATHAATGSAPPGGGPGAGEAADGPPMTMSEFLAHQAALQQEAAEVLPGRIDVCTFDEGYIRQPVYACLTCAPLPPPPEVLFFFFFFFFLWREMPRDFFLGSIMKSC